MPLSVRGVVAGAAPTHLLAAIVVHMAGEQAAHRWDTVNPHFASPAAEPLLRVPQAQSACIPTGIGTGTSARDAAGALGVAAAAPNPAEMPDLAHCAHLPQQGGTVSPPLIGFTRRHTHSWRNHWNNALIGGRGGSCDGQISS